MQDDSKWKLILAVVRPHLVEALLDCLKLAPIESLLIKEVKGFGRQKNMLDRYSGSDFELAFCPRSSYRSGSMHSDSRKCSNCSRKPVGQVEWGMARSW